MKQPFDCVSVIVCVCVCACVAECDTLSVFPI